MCTKWFLSIHNIIMASLYVSTDRIKQLLLNLLENDLPTERGEHALTLCVSVKNQKGTSPRQSVVAFTPENYPRNNAASSRDPKINTCFILTFGF